ncbi:hypothetical protein GOBAR_AA39924 [Gossypium barbadense]|uniref:Endonuclease/exonuclease/phosphatase domain-containing protein n=1 Tax=Gossypium barbadense TaxID=3634 RepID=A0A2P5VPL6_GOSBA|nr:hypothetical protein GOBAR_AA39924 [Gossypium barbadense]
MLIYSKHDIDFLVKLGNHNNLKVIGFYGHANPNLRSSWWEMLRRVSASIGEDWVVGGDFNAILNDAKKDGGHKKEWAQMKEFQETMDKLALVDIKLERGWFIWINNMSGDSMIREMLDRFLTSISMIENFPFMAM